MKKHLVVRATLLVLGMGLAALPRASADTTAAAPATTTKASAADKAFLTDALKGGMAEVDMGQLAADHGSSPEVIEFGKKMVTDHTRLGNELKPLAASKEVTAPPELDSKTKAMRDKLSKRSGADFDREYMQCMLKDHEKDVAAFQKEVKASKDPDVQSWASRSLPTLQEHLRMARTITAGLKKK